MRRKLNTPLGSENLPAMSSETPASALPNALPLASGEFQRNEQIDRASGPILPYVGFYSSKANNALDVRAALGSPVEGTPYLLVGTEDGESRIYPASTFGLVVVDEFPYWATLDENHHPDNVWLERQPFGAEFGGRPIKGNILAVVLVLPGRGQGGELPEELRPAVATLTTFRATKVPFVREHLDAVERTTKPAWASAPANAPVIGLGVPPRYRVVSEVVVERKASRSTGRPYTVASARPNTITMGQLDALAAYSKDARCQNALRVVLDGFERRKADLSARAAETATRGG